MDAWTALLSLRHRKGSPVTAPSHLVDVLCRPDPLPLLHPKLQPKPLLRKFLNNLSETLQVDPWSKWVQEVLDGELCVGLRDPCAALFEGR